MTPLKLGLTLILIGFIGAIIGYSSITAYNSLSFVKVGVTGNIIQLIGIGFIEVGR